MDVFDGVDFPSTRRGHFGNHSLAEEAVTPRDGSQLDGIFLDKIYRAVRAAVSGIRDTARSLALPPWMPRDEEQRFFAHWDEAYREIRQGNLAVGAAAALPADTTELHRHNVVATLRRDHESSRILPPPASSSQVQVAPVTGSV